MLVLHVGLPKTGTTSLQRILPRVPMVDAIVPPADGSDYFTSVGARVIASVWSVRAAAPTPSELAAFRELARHPHRTLVVSWEDLTFPVPLSATPPAERIRRVVQRLDPAADSTTIVCTIRPQGQWLASLYAQRPAHSSFDAFLRWWLRRIRHGPHDVIGFEQLDRALSTIVERDRIRFIPLRDFGSSGFWGAFSAGRSDLATAMAAAHAVDAAPLNTRRTSEQSWQAGRTPRLRGRLAIRVEAGRPVHRVITSHWNVPLRLASRLTRQSVPEVRLTPEAEARIMDSYAADNHHLIAARGIEIL